MSNTQPIAKRQCSFVGQLADYPAGTTRQCVLVEGHQCDHMASLPHPSVVHGPQVNHAERRAHAVADQFGDAFRPCKGCNRVHAGATEHIKCLEKHLKAARDEIRKCGGPAHAGS